MRFARKITDPAQEKLLVGNIVYRKCNMGDFQIHYAILLVALFQLLRMHLIINFVLVYPAYFMNELHFSFEWEKNLKFYLFENFLLQIIIYIHRKNTVMELCKKL